MGRKTLKHVEVEDDEEEGYEKTSIKAEVQDNKTQVKVELKFLTTALNSRYSSRHLRQSGCN